MEEGRTTSACDAVVDALVNAYCFSVRPASTLAQDIPQAAYGADADSIITAPNRAQLQVLYSMKSYLEASAKRGSDT